MNIRITATTIRAVKFVDSFEIRLLSQELLGSNLGQLYFRGAVFIS